MKLDVKDLAGLISGATIIINDCSIQVFCGAVKGKEEGDDEEGSYQTNAIGFLAEGQPDEVEVLEDDEEFEEDPEN